ncbi:MAG: winged helix-turn-helix transcriptional regulator [Clostridia bacterium]|nr:winged helix-turn-helix transcriptional regulator [Clostridia bacterium]
MRGRVLYVGLDPDLPAFLSAWGTGGFRVSTLNPTKYKGERADLLLWDLDASPLPAELPDGVRVVTVGYREDADLVRPFPFSEFESLLDPDPAKGGPVPSPVGRELFAGGVSVRLSPLEYDLFTALSDAAATVPAERLARVGGRDLSPHALGVAIFSLRKKLDRLPDPPRIRSERGSGYRLVPTGEK